MLFDTLYEQLKNEDETLEEGFFDRLSARGEGRKEAGKQKRRNSMSGVQAFGQRLAGDEQGVQDTLDQTIDPALAKEFGQIKGLTDRFAKDLQKLRLLPEGDLQKFSERLNVVVQKYLVKELKGGE